MLRGGGRAGRPGNAVNLEKLNKQLRRDIAANPKKAAALGLMVLVALYFWGPLVWKFLSARGGPRQANASTASLILTDDPVEPGQQNKGRGGRSKFRWEKVRQLIRQDPQMVSATFDVAWIDPFGKLLGAQGKGAEQTTPEEDPAVIAAAQAAAAVVNPKDLGVVLGGVMFGQRRKLATINSESYREGDVVSLADKQDKTVIYKYRVFRIDRDSVQLESGGSLFRLELVQPKLAPGDELEQGPTKSN
jgi:hypothetical protein